KKLDVQNVRFDPPTTPDRMPAYYRGADALVFPTLEDAWGLVVNEALWSGLPVISSIYAGCTRELVPVDQRFDPLDPNDIDRAMTAAVANRLAPPDLSVLKTSTQVAATITRDIENALGRNSSSDEGARPAPTISHARAA
ncbi:MAG: glycosyltransferase, partial [Planctomycetota bacterium]